MDVYRIYRDGGFEICFMEDEEEKQLCFDCGITYHLAVIIYVLNEGEVVTKYYRNFEKDVHFIHFELLMTKVTRF